MGDSIMRPNSRSQASGRQSWRAARRHPQGSSGGKQVARWSLSLLALLLAVALGMLLMQGCQPPGKAHLAILQIPYGSGSTPPIYFATSDVAYLEEHLQQRVTQIEVADRGKWLALRESASMHRLAENLADLQVAPEDRLLLYVSAHGISSQGEPFLLGNELDLKQSSGRGGAVARYPLRDFLRQMAEAPGSLKLLILDWGRVRHDPRLGVAWNEFPQLVAEVLREMDDPRLWVLLSHGDNEPAVNFSDGYSLFARAVAEGLGGAADAHPRDRNVSLAELHGYILARLEAWASPDPERRHATRPQLLQAGRGLVTDLADARNIRLVRVRPSPSASSASPGSSGAADKATGGDGEANESGSPDRREPGILDHVAGEVGRELGRELQSTVRRNTIVSRAESASSRTRSNLDQLRRALPPPAAEPASPDSTSSRPTGRDSAEAATDPASDGPEAATAPDGEDDSDHDQANDRKPSDSPQRPEPATRFPTHPPSNSLADLLAADGLALKSLSDADQTILGVLHRAWWLRDQLQQRYNSARVSPVDFAPHRWRQLNARLQQVEQQFLAGHDPEGMTESLLRLMGELQELQGVLEGSGGEGGRGGGTGRAGTGSWGESWLRYRASAEFPLQYPEDPLLKQGLEVERQLRLAFFGLPWLLQWQAVELSLFSQTEPPREVRQLVADCQALKQVLDALAEQPLDEMGLERLRDQQRDLDRAERALREALERRLLESLRTRHPTLRQRRLLPLVASPFLPADQRARVLAQLLQPLEERPVADDWKLTTPPQPRWLEVEQGSRQLTLLTLGMLEIVGWEESESPAATPLSSGPDALRTLGDLFRDRLAALGGPVSQDLVTRSAHGSDPLWPLLLLDDRDLLVEHRFPRSSLKPPTRPARLLIGSLSEPTLSLENWERVTLPIRSEGEVGDELTVTFQFPMDRLQVAEANGAPPTSPTDPRIIRPRQPLTFQRTAGGERDDGEGGVWQLPLYVRAITPATASLSRVRLELTLSTTKVPPRTEGLDEWQLPAPPNVVRLRARREGGSHQQELPGGIRLRPHPNRKTGFEFSLVNESLRARKVEVEVFRVSRAPASVRRAPGRFFDGEVFDQRLSRLMLTSDDRVRSDVRRTHRVLATSEPVTLPAGLDEIRIPLVAPSDSTSSGGASGGDESDEGGSTTRTSSPGSVLAEVTHGLLCVVTDSERPDEQWQYWLEIYPLAPRNYLRAEARYTRGRIYVRLNLPPNDQSLAPEPLGEEGAIPIYLHAVDSTAEANQAAKIESLDQGPVEVWIAAPQDDQRRTVWIDVDGVPRAFAFDVPCREGARGDDLRQERWQLEIKHLATDPEQSRTATRDRELPMAFREDRRLWVGLNVDMPINAFEGGAHQDVLELGLGEETPRVFFSDRDHQVHLTDVQGGTLVLDTVVSDHRHALDINGRRGEVRVVARGVYQNSEKRDVVPVILDGTPPTMTRLSLADSSIAHGAKLTVQVAADDGSAGSGVASIRVGFDRNGNGQLDDDDQPVVVEQSAGRVELETMELQVGRSYRVLAEATDRVGFSSSLMQQSIQILPPKMPEEEQKPTKGDIRGVVLFNGVAPVSRNLVTVSLEGAGVAPVRTGDGGSFVFRDVPVGTYTLKASGSFSGAACAGELEGVVVPSRDRIVLPVQRP